MYLKVFIQYNVKVTQPVTQHILLDSKHVISCVVVPMVV